MSGDLKLNGTLNLSGKLKLNAASGKVLVGGMEALVLKSGTKHGVGVPVIMPPPPTGPLDQVADVEISKTFNEDVSILSNNESLPVIALGICLQGSNLTWPGMVLVSTNNSGVTINHVLINVKGDSGITLPNGGSISFNTSGQN